MEEEVQIQKRAADVLTEKAFTFDIDIRPRNRVHAFLQRWSRTARYFPKCRSFTIRPLTLGSCHRISAIIVDAAPITTLDLPTLIEAMATNCPKMAEVIAAAIHNQKPEPPRQLVELLLWNLTQKELKLLFHYVANSFNVSDFMNTIISMKGINTLQVKEKEMSPPVPGDTLEEP